MKKIELYHEGKPVAEIELDGFDLKTGGDQPEIAKDWIDLARKKIGEDPEEIMDFLPYYVGGYSKACAVGYTPNRSVFERWKSAA